jgi:hypothetical protein
MYSSPNNKLDLSEINAEEHEALHEEDQLKSVTYTSSKSVLALSVMSNLRKKLESCTKHFAYRLSLAIINLCYICLAIVYLLIMQDVDNDNIIGLTSVLFSFTLILLAFHTFILCGVGCKVRVSMDYAFLLVVLTMEIVEMSYRANSDFERKLATDEVKYILGLTRICRAFMLHRRC